MSDKMINNKMYLSLSIGNNARCGVLDHMLGLREDQPAREPKGKTLPGWALR
jgi:hypothetical protein